MRHRLAMILARRDARVQALAHVLTLIAGGSSLAQACRDAGVSHDTVERRRKSEPDYQAGYIGSVRQCRQVLRLRMLVLLDAPLAPGRAARSARNREVARLHDALAATYSSGAVNGGRRPKS